MIDENAGSGKSLAKEIYKYTVLRMPAISTFFGIVIEMFWREHGPPHFHASYAEYEAVIELESLDIIRGHLPRRVEAMVTEWAEKHRLAIRENWERCARLEHPQPIPPLQ